MAGTGFYVPTSSNSNSAVAHYTHTQSAANTLWVIPHNLGFYPSITVFDAMGNEVLVGINHVSINEARVGFDAPMSGTAICS